MSHFHHETPAAQDFLAMCIILIFASGVSVNARPPAGPPLASRTPFVGSAADHLLNLCDQLIQIERLGHDFHAVLHATVANRCVLGIAG